VEGLAVLATRAGRASVQHLVELSRIRRDCVKDQPEPIPKGSPGVAHQIVDLRGFEPLTSCLPSKRSTN
jgi:hypothetical protein